MPITLTPEQEAWLRSHVATGVFASIEAAARQLIDERIAERVAEASRAKSRNRREVLLAGVLSDADLDAIARMEMSPRYKHLDNELQ